MRIDRALRSDERLTLVTYSNNDCGWCDMAYEMMNDQPFKCFACGAKWSQVIVRDRKTNPGAYE